MILADSGKVPGAVIGVVGILMILFPGFFIALGDISAALKGYQPIEGHLFRSRWWVRAMGVFALIVGIAILSQ